MDNTRSPWLGLAASALPGGSRSLIAAGRANPAPRPGGAAFDGRPRAMAPIDLPQAPANPTPQPAPPADDEQGGLGSPSVSFHAAPVSLPPSPSLSRASSGSTVLADAVERSDQAAAAGVKPWRLPCFAKARYVARVGFALFGHACASVLYAVTWMAPMGTRDVYEASRHNLRQVLAGVDPLSGPVTAGAPPAGAAGLQAPVQAQTQTDAAAGNGRFAGIIGRMKQAQAQYRKAVDQAKVDFAKKAFYMKCLDVALGAAAVAVAVTVAVMSGGAALAIPAVIVTGVLLYWAVADWQCARHNLEAAREGRPQLPMGNNALANTLYRYHTEVQGMAPEEARWESAVTASITSALIAGVTLAMGVAIGVPVRVGISITRFAISASYRLHSVGELGLARLLASRQREVGRQGGHETGAPDAAGAASPSTPALPRCFDDQALEPLMDLLKAQGLVGPARTEAAAHALSTPLTPAMTSIAESEFGDADSEVDDASESEETDEAGSESVDEDSDDEWFPGAVGTPAAEPPRAPAATPPPRVLTRHEAELLTRWVQTASSFDPLIDAVGDPDPAVRAHRFDAFLAELVRKDEASARMARLGDARFVGVNSIYLASFLRGLVTFCLAR